MSDDNAHARSVAEQLRLAEENDNLPEEIAERYDLDEDEDDQEDGDNDLRTDGGEELAGEVIRGVDAEFDSILDAVDDSLRELSTPSDPWTTRKAVRAKTRERGFPLDESKRVAADLGGNESAFVWFGYILRAHPHVLQAAIEDEADADVPRKILLGQLNERRQELLAGDDAE